MVWKSETYPDSSFSIPHFDNSPRWSMLKDVKCTFLGSRHFFRSNAPMSILVGKNCQVLLFRVFQDFSIAWSVSVWNLYSTMTMTMVCVLDATAACICMIQKDWGWFIIWNVQQICFRISGSQHQSRDPLEITSETFSFEWQKWFWFCILSYFIDAPLKDRGQKFSWVK